MFNSKQYEWSDITIFMGGKIVTGARSIKYTKKQEKEVLYAKGNTGHSIQRGNIDISGEISLTQSEFETLKLSNNGSILNMHLDIMISYGNPNNGDIPITDQIQFVEFTEESKEMKQGDKFMDVKIPFIALDVVKVQ